jgi:SAM-dependent methyltransferase
VHSRIVQAELLDLLPPAHPDVRHNRRDLRLTNLVMGNHRWLARTLRACARPGENLLELGAGTGELAARLAREGWRVAGLDRCPIPERWPAAARWHGADLRHFDGYSAYEVVYGNLIFHQFTAAELRALGARLQARSRLLVACEPARWRRSQWLFGLLAPVFGANYVSQHDGQVSIAAGFLGEELPHLLGLDPARWRWRCATTLIGAYHLTAWRREEP